MSFSLPTVNTGLNWSRGRYAPLGEAPHPKQVTSPQFAVDYQIEQLEIPDVAPQLQTHANGPNLITLQWGLLARTMAFVPGRLAWFVGQ